MSSYIDRKKYAQEIRRNDQIPIWRWHPRQIHGSLIAICVVRSFMPDNVLTGTYSNLSRIFQSVESFIKHLSTPRTKMAKMKRRKGVGLRFNTSVFLSSFQPSKSLTMFFFTSSSVTSNYTVKRGYFHQSTFLSKI